MKLSLILTISAIYMGLLGLGYLLSPAAMSFGVVDATASSALIALLRIPASVMLGVALLNWLARDSDASKAREAIVMANIVGFGLGAILIAWGALTGSPAVTWVFVVINLLIAAAFYLTRGKG